MNRLVVQNKFQKFTAKSILMTATLPILLTACGGGGSYSPPNITPQNIPINDTLPVITPPPDRFLTNEFYRSWGLDAINADAAYREGLTGKGAVIAMLDTGIDAEHPDLIGRVHSASREFGNTGELIETRTFSNGGRGPIHGTMAAGVAVANKNGDGIHGVAYEAKVMMLKLVMDDPSDEDDGHRIAREKYVEAIDYAIANGASVLTFGVAHWDEDSVKVQNPDHPIDPVNLMTKSQSDDVKAAYQRAIDAGLVIVMPSGNEYAPETTLFVKSLLDVPGNENAVIIVGGILEGNEPFDRSNKAGSYMNNFVVAPTLVKGPIPFHSGWSGIEDAIGATYANTSNGTSFSHPHVEGMAALLMQAFPNLNAREVIEIILESATDLGEPGVDPIFGHGMINIEAALNPLGATKVSSVAGDIFELKLSFSMLSPAFGDVFHKSKGLSSVMIMDKYDRAFKTDLGTNINQPGAYGVDMDALYANQRMQQQVSLSMGNDANFGFGFYDKNKDIKALAFAMPSSQRSTMALSRPTVMFQGTMQNGMGYGFAYGLTASDILDRQNPALNHSAGFMLAPQLKNNYLGASENQQSAGFTHDVNTTTSLSYGASVVHYDQSFGALKPAEQEASALQAVIRATKTIKGLNLRFTGGAIAEKNAILGSRSTGALKLGDDATTFYGRLEVSLDVGAEGSFFATSNYGLTEVSGLGNALITDMTRFHTSSFSVGYVNRNIMSDGDQLGIVISQPLRVENGSMQIVTPVGHNYMTGQSHFNTAKESLSPTGREIDMELSYRWNIGNLALGTSAIIQRHVGHNEKSAKAATIMITAATRF